jgi:hypothetical protein
MTFASPKRLLFLAALVMVFVLALAPASFAGEDPGPTQTGETLGATTTGSINSSGSSSSSATSAKSKKDTVRAKGGIQTGFGGMATASGPSMLLVLALAAGGFVVLAGAAGIAPAYRRSDR